MCIYIRQAHGNWAPPRRLEHLDPATGRTRVYLGVSSSLRPRTLEA